jgi:hypothetical protein
MTIPELTGRELEQVDGSGASVRQWTFRLTAGCLINVESDWRVVLDGRILLAARDHEQMFGRQKPVDAIHEAERLLKGKAISNATLSPTGDLVLAFEGGTRLETFANSSGYESCNIWLPGGKQFIVMGGGEVAEF